MTDRLTPERWREAVNVLLDQATDMALELDAVRAERDALTAELNQRNRAERAVMDPEGELSAAQQTIARLVEERDTIGFAGLWRQADRRADRAEATLAAIRAWAEDCPSGGGWNMTRHLKSQVLALLPPAPAEKALE